MQELTFQFPAFNALLQSAAFTQAPNGSRLNFTDLRPSHPELIPMAWFGDAAFRSSITDKFKEPMTRLVFLTEPVVRTCTKTDPEGNVLETRESAPEIPMWTSLGGWTAANSLQDFKAPDWTTFFVSIR